jgi:uncharacterized protein GlcG (DUF336 family)
MNHDTMSQIVDSIVKQLKPSSCQDDISLDAAKRLIEKVKDKALEMGIQVVVAVSGKSARPVAVECMDNSYIASFDIALNKSFTAVALKMSTSALKPLAQPGAPLYGIQFTNNGKIVIFGGGVPLRNKDGVIIGGLGVSGGTEDQDTNLAEYGEAVFHNCI